MKKANWEVTVRFKDGLISLGFQNLDARMVYDAIMDCLRRAEIRSGIVIVRGNGTDHIVGVEDTLAKRLVAKIREALGESDPTTQLREAA